MLVGSRRSAPLLFVVKSPSRRMGSVELRVHQTRRLLGAAFPEMETLVVAFDRDLRRSATKARALVFEKYAYSAVTQSQLGELGERTSLIGDVVDAPLNRAWDHVPHVLISPTISRTALLQKGLPDAEVAFVPHHADLRIPVLSRRHASFACAYFGRPENTVHLEALKLEVFVTSKSNHAWMGAVSDYPTHYVVRNPESCDGAKPFTKGAIAALVGAPVIAAATDPEAREFLSDEYPYLSVDAEFQNVRAALELARGTFESKEWKFALEVMAEVHRRTSPASVVSHWSAVLDRASSR